MRWEFITGDAYSVFVYMEFELYTESPDDGETAAVTAVGLTVVVVVEVAVDVDVDAGEGVYLGAYFLLTSTSLAELLSLGTFFALIDVGILLTVRA